MQGMKPASLLLACAAFAAFSVSAEPVVPGEFTDPTNLRKEAENGSGDWYVAPDHLRFPYVSTYYVEPTVTTKQKVSIPFYVTDWDHSKVRFLDDSFRFTVHCKWIGPDGRAREKEQRNVPSGDGAFDLGKLPAGDYDVCVWAVDLGNGVESHRVWHKFRVVEPDFLEIPASKTFRVSEKDLADYGIRNDGDLGRKVLVEIPDPPEGTKGDEATRLLFEALDAHVKANPPAPRKGAPGYTVFIAAKDGKPVVGSFKKSRIVFDKGYDTNAVEQAAIATAEGLQKLLDDKAAAGFRKVVLAPGTYRVSPFRRVRLPDGVTLDLNGATLKENAFTGCHSVVVAIENVRDAHLVNGTIEGDYYEHDYAGSDKNSEWPMGFHIDGDAIFCSVENVTVKDITGYGAGNGMGRDEDGQLQWFYDGLGGWEKGGLRPADGSLDGTEAGRCTSGFLQLKDAALAVGWLQVSAYLGYQGVRGKAWQLTGCWYDAEKNFLCSETIHQYRPVPIPKGAAFLRVSLAADEPKDAGDARLVATLFHIPIGCTVRGCVFDRCRCVGYAASAMQDFLFEDNLFTHSGEAAAKCAFDAEDGWDMMRDATFRGNRCEENPLNNRLLTCAGHNFVFERNKCGLYFWPRTYSPCVRDNEIDVGVFKCGRRHRSGYGRFERNVYSKALEVPAEGSSYQGWYFAFSDLDRSVADPANPFTVRFGSNARAVGGVFTGRNVSIPEVFGTRFVDCTIERLDSGHWTGAAMEGGRFRIVNRTNLFERCSFKGVEFGGVNGGEQTFEDCTFEDCRFGGLQTASVKFRRCTFAGGSVGNGYWTNPSSIDCEDCVFDATGGHWIKFGTYATGTFRFDRCRIGSSDGSCGQFVDLFDWRSSTGDQWPGSIEFRNCTVGEGVAALVGCSTMSANGYLRPGNDPTKKLDFVFEGNTLATGAVERAELPRRR